MSELWYSYKKKLKIQKWASTHVYVSKYNQITYDIFQPEII